MKQDPALSRMQKTWAIELQSGLASAQALFGSSLCCTVSNGCLEAGKKGLGFGVGTEPLSSYFVSQGCVGLATDAPGDITDEGWKHTAQHATKTENL